MSILEPINPGEWDARKARHLLNRAGFGVPRERVERLASMTPEEAVGSLCDFTGSDAPAPDFLMEPITPGQVRQQHPDLDYEAQQKFVRERRQEERKAIDQLKAWWLARVVHTPDPLEEKLALFWHGHFAVSAQKVQYSAHMHDYYDVLRAHAAGNAKALTIAVGQTPAMLDYLDNRRSTKQKPNENWARELMELFTMGQRTYTEEDIKASARAFTGWTTDGNAFRYNLATHDTGEKAFLGRTGHFDGWDILDIIFEQPATAEFLSAKLWKYFAKEEVDADAVTALAAVMRESNYEIRPVLRALFQSKRFYADDIIGTQVKSPAQYVAQLCEDLGLERLPYGAMAQGTRVLGQDLFYPPNVKGWDGNRAWINANSLLLRYNLPVALAQASIKGARGDGKADDGMMMMGMQSGVEPALMADADDAMVPMEKKGPGQEERQAYSRAAREAVAEKLRALPPQERQAMRAELESATGKERRALLAELGVGPPPWTIEGPMRLFDRIEFTTAGQCLDAIAARFLSVPVSAPQRAALLQALGAAGEDTPLERTSISLDQRQAVLRLITSMAEYQLC
jgi:uncharacterized protein (DUF1800 family)